MIASCASYTPEKIPGPTVFVEAKIPIHARPKPVTLNDVHFDVVTEANLAEFLAKTKDPITGKSVFIAVTVKGYEAMSLNIAELRRYILQQNQLVAYYESAASDN